MLELTSYQIFFMVLHGCLLAFAIAFLFGGSTSKNNKVVSYREFQRKKQRQQRTRKASSASGAQNVRDVQEVRDVSEIRDVYEAAAGSDCHPYPQRQICASKPRLMTANSHNKTVTNFTVTATDTAVDFRFD